MEEMHALQPDYIALQEMAAGRVLSDQDHERVNEILKSNPLTVTRLYRAMEWLKTKPEIEKKKAVPPKAKPSVDTGHVYSVDLAKPGDAYDAIMDAKKKAPKFEVKPSLPWSDENSNPLEDMKNFLMQYKDMEAPAVEPVDLSHYYVGNYHNPWHKINHEYDHEYHWHYGKQDTSEWEENPANKIYQEAQQVDPWPIIPITGI